MSWVAKPVTESHRRAVGCLMSRSRLPPLGKGWDDREDEGRGQDGCDGARIPRRLARVQTPVPNSSNWPVHDHQQRRREQRQREQERMDHLLERQDHAVLARVTDVPVGGQRVGNRRRHQQREAQAN